MNGWLYVKRKHALVGRESHTTADYETSAIFFVKPYEGKLYRCKRKNSSQTTELTMQILGTAPGAA